MARKPRHMLLSPFLPYRGLQPGPQPAHPGLQSDMGCQGVSPQSCRASHGQTHSLAQVELGAVPTHCWWGLGFTLPLWAPSP